MKQEEKQMLLKDLCGRLPYGVELYIEDSKKLPDNEHISVGFIGGYALNKEGCQDFLINDVLECLDNGSVVKPYLRPMSSMTEEEEKVFNNFLEFQAEYVSDADLDNKTDMYDWLLEHHFDYRGLIEKGLALEASKDMYKTE